MLLYRTVHMQAASALGHRHYCIVSHLGLCMGSDCWLHLFVNLKYLRLLLCLIFILNFCSFVVLTPHFAHGEL